MAMLTHYLASRFPSGERETVCKIRTFVLLTTSLASQVTCAECIRIDKEGPNGDLLEKEL